MRHLCLVLALLSLTACASHPIVDTARVDPARYQYDLEDCERLAMQVDQRYPVVQSTAAGAAVGALFGALIWAMTGHSEDFWYSTGWGAAGGAVNGAFGADHEKSYVVRNCLHNRGYVVLN